MAARCNDSCGVVSLCEVDAADQLQLMQSHQSDARRDGGGIDTVEELKELKVFRHRRATCLSR